MFVRIQYMQGALVMYSNGLHTYLCVYFELRAYVCTVSM